MTVRISVRPAHSPEVEIAVPIQDQSTIATREEDIKGALIEAVRGIIRVYDLDLKVG